MGQTKISGHCYVKNGELDVVNFGCAKSRRVGILHNLSDMRRKALAGFSLRLDRVPVAYHRSICLSLFSLRGSRLGLLSFRLPLFPPISPTQSVSIQLPITDCGNSASR
jgi:hypothetical protein